MHSPPERDLPRAVIFELENTLLDRRPAWQYAIEQAVGTVCHERIDARNLAQGYAHRPVTHALAVLVDDLDTRLQCARQWQRLYYRSGIKKLMVHDGVSMMLDRLRHAGVELGVISHEPHAIARKELESTGIDRFLAVLAAQPEDEPWSPEERLEQCRAFLDYQADELCFVSYESGDLDRVEAAGAIALRAAWPDAGEDEAGIAHPSHTLDVVRRAWDATRADR